MLERILELRPAVCATIADRQLFSSSVASKLELREAEWITIEEMVKVLRPLQQATTILCSNSKITISLVRPIVSNLVNRHLKSKGNDSVEELREILSYQLSRRFLLGKEKMKKIIN